MKARAFPLMLEAGRHANSPLNVRMLPNDQRPSTATVEFIEFLLRAPRAKSALRRK